jgi:7-cyano-7-deazaguanine synthase in queuosine biosynthesis
LAFKRGERENIARRIALSIPVVNFQAFERLKSELEYILYFLSHDSWSFEFIRAGGIPEQSLIWRTVSGKTLLFSGGLDSFAGAVELLDAHGADGVQLASHVTANQVTRSSQEQLQTYLAGKYKATLTRVVVRSGGRNFKDFPFPSDKDREDTQRTRSFMFLAIAALAARRSGHSEIVMIAENGQMAIHLPLSAARIGAFSTHTAHPEFVAKVGDYFTQLLGYSITVENPYLYRTKAEVVNRLVQSHRKAIGFSVSCWRGSRTGKSFHHCGECVPCLIRRIALEFHDVSLPEYERDLLVEDVSSLGPNDEGKRNLSELSEFIHAFRAKRDRELLFEYIDLVNEQIDPTAAIGMYRRFAHEAHTVLSRYASVATTMLGLNQSNVSQTKQSLRKRSRKK